jgi:integrase
MPLPDGVFRIVKPSGKVYLYHQKDRGKATRGPLTRLPEPGTPEWYQAIAELTGQSRFKAGTVSSVIDAIKASARWKALKPNTVALYSSAISAIEAAWGNLPAAGIRANHVATLLDRYADRPAMGNQILVQVKEVLKIAVQQGLRTDNPAREIDALNEQTDGAKPLTAAAWAALQSSEAPEALRRFGVLGRATGQRIGDVLAMRPMDRDGTGIACTITKLGGKPHWCVLTSAEAKTIDGWKQFPASAFVTRPDGRRFDPASFRHVWRDYLNTPAGEALKGFTPHDLRATKVCDERMAGYTHQEISARVGMSVGMVMRYSQHIDQRLIASTSTKPEPKLKTRVNRPENPKGK